MTVLSTSTDILTPPPEAQQDQDIARVMQAAIEHHRRQEYAEAAALYTSVLNTDNDHLDANYNLGVLRLQTDQPAEAAPHFEVVLGQTPKNGQIWVYYINALVGSRQSDAARAALELARQQGLPENAVQTLRARIDGEEEPIPDTPVEEATPEPEAAAEPAPSETEQRLKLDTRRASLKDLRQYQQLFNSGKLEAALKVARRLTTDYPSHGDCWGEFARVLQATGNYTEAVDASANAARLLPNNVSAQATFADRLIITRQFPRAKAHCLEALERFPDNAVLHRNLGTALLETGEPDEGFVHLHRSVELAPNAATEFDALGTALGRHGLYAEAEAAFRRALELAPMQASTHSNLLFYLMHKPDVDAATVFAEFRDFAARHEAPLRGQRPQHANDRNPSRRLRIGFVSGDLINHPVAYFFLSVLEHLVHDSSLSLHIYSNYMVTDTFTEQIRQHAQTWTEIFGMTNDVVAQKIRDDKIDILIDLSGHTGRNRLTVFAQKPAPVQASWIGNPATTGLDSVDYYLSDRFVTPLEQFEPRFSEKLAFLPALAPFKPHPQAPAVNELPALNNGFITFGTFSRIVKIGPEVVALWARVLREVPNSRLLIGGIAAQDQMFKLSRMFEKEGVDLNRFSFLNRATVTTYLQQHHLIDACLDSFPFGNSTTTMQALWMGVPTITLPGDSMASRSSTGWLCHLGLDAAFVAQDKDDYVSKCIALANDPEALAIVRRELREYCRQSVLIDASAIANAASRAFRVMWQRWCDGQPPEHFEILAQANAPSTVPTPSRDTSDRSSTSETNAGQAHHSPAANTGEIVLQPAYDQIAFFCPNVVTGGPEAVHQLAHTINKLGGNASLVYYGGESKVHIDEHTIRAVHVPNPAADEAYGMYEPVALREMTLSSRTLVVYPEVLAGHAQQATSSKRAIWWLSVDNAVSANPRLAEARYAAELFSNPDIIHFYQSDYARRFIERHGGRAVLPLFDFINREYFSTNAAAASPARRNVGLFPRKGADLAARFIKLNGHLPFTQIQNMTRDQVRSALSECAVYIDFGHHPGKDRVPREAAASGAVVFLHDRGSARHYADHPLDSYYLFSDNDIEGGQLQTKIEDALAHHDEHFSNQRLYRQRILLEMEEFSLQVKTAFFEPRSRN